MRVSPQKDSAVEEKLGRVAKDRFSFRRLIKPRDHTVYIGLVGGCDPASAAVRHAQAFLRFDRRPGYFSEVFVFLEPGRNFAHGETNVICAPIVGADPTRPERLGLVRGNDRDFGDVHRYPNVGVISVTLQQDARERTARFRRAVEKPEFRKDFQRSAGVADVRRLWNLVAAWQPYLFEPDRVPNPLHEGVSHPGTLLARWLLQEVGVEGAPGATEDADAPEHLWAFAQWWNEAMRDESVGATVRYYKHITDPGCRVRKD